MNLRDFTRRARASRLDRKAKFEAALDRARRDLQLSEGASLWSHPPTHHIFIRGRSDGADGTTYRQR